MSSEAADIGVTGKDSIMEYGASTTFYETMDLGFGKCKMMTRLAERVSRTIRQNQGSHEVCEHRQGVF